MVQLSFGELVMEQAPRIIVSLHSFNPVYEGEVRDFDVGVLSSVDDRLALKVRASIPFSALSVPSKPPSQYHWAGAICIHTWWLPRPPQRALEWEGRIHVRA